MDCFKSDCPKNFLSARVPGQKEKSGDMPSDKEDGKRYYDNPFEDYEPGKENQYIDLEAGKINPTFLEKIKSFSENLLLTLEEKLPSMEKDSSMYTGTSGVALLYFLMSEKLKNPDYFEKAATLIEKSLDDMKEKDMSFLCGASGPLALGSVIFRRQNKKSLYRKCVTQLVQYVPVAANRKNQMSDELLYGRVGLLYALLFVDKYLPGTIIAGYIKQVINAIMDSGQKTAQQNDIEANVAFQWHNKIYFGGAHGIAGILYVLLQSKPFITPEQIDLVKNTVDYLVSVRYPSGNFPSSLGSKTDQLVHWCHGAPGTVQMLCAAYEEYKNESYLAAAEKCGDVVWERGLLRKGYGICHGVAGNAYTFLILYQLTKNVKHLHRACSFADWCTSYNQYQQKSPDRPYSLFEGLAGTIYFLIDIQDPLTAKFPGFTL